MGLPYLIKVDRLIDNLYQDKEFQAIVQQAIDKKTKLSARIQMLEEKGAL